MIPDETIQFLAWLAAVLCCLVSGIFAKGFAESSPRKFAAMILFSLSWAMLVPYYDYKDPTSIFLLPVFNGILQILVGAILLRESNCSNNNAISIWSTRAEYSALLMLLFIVNPGNIIGDLSNSNVTIVINIWSHTLISIIGYVCMWFGLTKLIEGAKRARPLSVTLGLILLIYAMSEIYFSICSTINPKKEEEMSAILAILFIVLKISLTVIFILIVKFQEAILGKKYDKHEKPIHYTIEKVFNW
jgi:hypothetical protein